MFSGEFFMVTNCMIVSRHPAAIEFIRQEANLPAEVPVKTEVAAEDVRDCIIFGNVPLHIAACAKKVIAIEFTGAPPRGQEYDVAAMRAAGAQLKCYRVMKGD